MFFNKNVNTIYLDMDGVLANFDKLARKILGMQPHDFERMYGSDKFWFKLKNYPEFYLKLEPMPDMKELYSYVLKYNPVILTGIPLDMEESHGYQKIQWSKNKFGMGQEIILTRSSKKSKFCKPGDIIIDDRPKYKQKWEDAGGLWITHTSAKSSIEALKKIGL